MRRLSFPALTATLALALAACSSAASATPSVAAPSVAAPSVEATSAAPSTAAGGATVAIKGFAFNPPTIEAKVGQTITWTNQDSATHTVTLDDKSVNSGNVASNATFSHAFATAGTFTYHCEIHKQMKGTITVSG
jgi:plastocyanin